MNTDTIILNDTAIAWKIKRMAAELWELHAHESEIIILGIEGTGYVLAKNIADELEQISGIEVKLLPLAINKKEPLNNEPRIAENLSDKAVILIDDVANSGKTLLYALKPVLAYVPKSIHLAVLIDRSHKRYPVVPDVIGYKLSTTLQENVVVSTEGDKVLRADLY